MVFGGVRGTVRESTCLEDDVESQCGRKARIIDGGVDGYEDPCLEFCKDGEASLDETPAHRIIFKVRQLS